MAGGRELAAVIASDAVRLGGRSLSAALGHARAGALAAPSVRGKGDPEADSVVPTDPTTLALALAAGRPPLERAVVDLWARHGMDGGAVARALGTAPGDAKARLGAVSAAWQEDLDPALMAWLGPGECDELSAVLEREGIGPAGAEPTVGALLSGAPAVAAHAGACETCRDRQRAMVSVQSLVGQVPLPPAPPQVRTMAAAARRRRPVPPPPLSPPRRSRWPRRVALGTAVLAATAGAVVAATASIVAWSPDAVAQRVRNITRVRTDALSLTPDVLGPASSSAVLTNRSARPEAWRATASVPWLTVTPPGGTIGPGERLTLRIVFAAAAPQGALHGTLTVTSPDGSVAAAALTGILDRPPQLDAELSGCTVTATAEDSDGLAAVLLDWQDLAGTHQVAMASVGAAYTAQLPPAGTWWVTAVDTLGNVATLPPRPAPALPCPAAAS
ncbi:MAG TPA: hypothetical protein VF954_00560 [Acidimicrobiales bacterium]